MDPEQKKVVRAADIARKYIGPKGGVLYHALWAELDRLQREGYSLLFDTMELSERDYRRRTEALGLEVKVRIDKAPT